MIRSPEVLYDVDKGKVHLICDIVCKVLNFSKLTILKPIFADFWSTRPFDALFEFIEAAYTLEDDTRHSQTEGSALSRYYR